jgi:hypothetical protein
LSISIAKLWLSGTVTAADHVIVHVADEHDVVVPAGVVAPSMKSAARVVAGDTYSADRARLAFDVAGGTAMLIVP